MDNFGRLGSDYSEAVLSHFDAPHNVGQLRDVEPSLSRSAAWGDKLTVYLRKDGEQRIAELKWQCLGAPVVIACASLASQLVVGWSSQQLETELPACLQEQLNLSAEQRYAALFVATAIKEATN